MARSGAARNLLQKLCSLPPEGGRPLPGAQLGSNTAAADLLSFFRQECEQDVEIICDDKKFSANGVILSARSAVFHKMLQGDFLEGRTRKIYSTDIRSIIMENFLEALTSDSCKILRDGNAAQYKDLIDLYMLADRYQFMGLLNRCESKLYDIVTKETVIDVLEACEKTGSKILRRRCMKRLQEFRGAELIAFLRGEDLWNDLRDMKVYIECTVPARMREHPPGANLEMIRKQTEIVCCEYDTVETLKKLIFAVWPISVKRQRLVFSGKHLDEERTLAEQGIQDGATISVMEVCRRRPPMNPGSPPSSGWEAGSSGISSPTPTSGMRCPSCEATPSGRCAICRNENSNLENGPPSGRNRRRSASRVPPIGRSNSTGSAPQESDEVPSPLANQSSRGPAPPRP